ncbi:hypothetical protein LI139_02415 [Veillonella atypica]|uniref:hypothetical protein n=1 Tax=Veillonella atypica TaxID=39777 RepID=UPI001D07363F|nr:hypothetical protein [Veillonella atypica]MCB6514495.1 hypothetical protein [Veillonella atypica]MCG4863180.1 hypothetical protein [Veillonella atypica]
MVLDIIVLIILNYFLNKKRRKNSPNLMMSKDAYCALSMLIFIFWVIILVFVSASEKHSYSSSLFLMNVSYIASFIFASLTYHMAVDIYQSKYNLKATILSILSIFPILNLIVLIALLLKKHNPSNTLSE